MSRNQPPAPSRTWAYFLDVDGTLIELADTPHSVKVDERMLRQICDLHQRVDGALALISGRRLADLDRLLGGLRLPVAGQHGLERRDGHGNVHSHALAPARIKSIADRLAPLRGRHPGLLLESKGATLAIHYRLAPRLGPYLHRLLRELVQPDCDGLELQAGKRVIEVKPSGYDKGTAIAEFMSQQPFTGRKPVFIGDDLTDEHGFAMVNQLGGISVKVGPGRTRAGYRLPGISSVLSWLAKVGEPHSKPAKEKM